MKTSQKAFNSKNVKIMEKFSKSLEFAKKNNLIKPHTKAFQENPVKEEQHRGNEKYFCK